MILSSGAGLELQASSEESTEQDPMLKPLSREFLVLSSHCTCTVRRVIRSRANREKRCDVGVVFFGGSPRRGRSIHCFFFLLLKCHWDKLDPRVRNLQVLVNKKNFLTLWIEKRPRIRQEPCLDGCPILGTGAVAKRHRCRTCVTKVRKRSCVSLSTCDVQ